MDTNNKIICPNCGTSIDVNDALSHQVEEQYKKKYNELWTKNAQELKLKSEELQRRETELQKSKEEQKQILDAQVQEQLQKEKQTLTAELKQKIDSEKAEELALINKELQEKSEQLKELNRAKAEVEQIKREKEELKDKLELDAKKALNEQLAIERERIQKLEQEKNQLTVVELRKQLEDQKRLTEEMIRKQEQGSMQLQGEAQELAIEDWLRQQFPLDTIDEIKKGMRGADCLQIVNTRMSQNCGLIYYESKRTKDFQAAWMEKFKIDMQAQKATFGVLVTEAMPKDMPRLGQRDGIWICTFEEFKALCFVIRESVILLHSATQSQENKGEKTAMLYNYLTGNEFKQHVEAIIESFVQMNDDLMAERRAMERLWKTREKQIQKVVDNTTYMYGSIKGIVGNAIQSIKLMELPETTEE